MTDEGAGPPAGRPDGSTSVRLTTRALLGRSGVSARFARLVVRLRYVLVLGWIAVAVLALLLPTSSSGGSGLAGFVPDDDPAIAAELRSFEAFGFPLSSRVLLVQHAPDGLSVEAQAKAVLRAAAVDQGTSSLPGVLGALPVPNTLGLFPGANESDTAVLTELFTSPTESFVHQRDAARDYAATFLGDSDDHVVGVTGSIPARASQATLIEGALPFVEVATVAAIGLLVALAFRSPVAAGVALVAAGVTAVVTLWVDALVAQVVGIAIPGDVQPLLVALLLGVVTDYCVFFLAGLRRELEDGRNGHDAVLRTTARTAPIIAVAGVTVAVGTGALLVARSPLFRGLGPGLAITVLTALVVTITFVPALLAVLGARSLWPSAARGPQQSGARPTFVDRITTPRSAGIVVAAAGTALAVACIPLLHLHLGVDFVSSLPSHDPVAVAAHEARGAFSPGILAPTEVLLEGDGVGRSQAPLDDLSRRLAAVHGVDAVLGPGDLPTADDLHVFRATSGRAARLLVVLGDRPLSAPAIDTISTLRRQLPGMLAQSGLSGVQASLVGDSALSEEIVRGTQRDLVRLSAAVLLANLLMLVLFLRAGLTSVLLLLSSVLGLGATLGLTVLVFQDLLHHTGLTFYVPFAAAVLLLSLGSDYNIYAVGQVWDEARSRPLLQALRAAVPGSTRAITAAALTLAASFGLLALVPLRPFRELAFAMVLGVLVDAVVVRSLLMPALLTLLGDNAQSLLPRGRWPARTGMARPTADVGRVS